MTTIYDTAKLRDIAARWHSGQWSPLYAYASTGTVRAGIDREIRSCLDKIEQSDWSHTVDFDIDPIEEHDQLQALLYHVEPDLALIQARAIGRERGEGAVAWWEQETLGGRVVGDTTATARYVLQGLEDGDPAVLDALPATFAEYTEVDLEGDCDWDEPNLADRAAHERWAATRVALWDAYQTAFQDTVHEFVTSACLETLDATGTDDHSPVEAESTDRRVPPEIQVARARYLGAWAATAEAAALRMMGDQAEAVVGRADHPFLPPAVPERDLGARVGFALPPNLDIHRARALYVIRRAELVQAWEEGRDAVWPAALKAAAMRAAGNLDEPAQFLESVVDDRLRDYAAAARADGQPDIDQPYVRAVRPGLPADAPQGWVTQRIGLWDGRESEVVYNPHRFAFTITSSVDNAATAELEAQRWDRRTTDGNRALWVRDPFDATRGALDRLDQRLAGLAGVGPDPTLEPPAPGLEL